MSERTDADKLANKLLDEPYADPDDDLRMLSRQLLRRREVIERLEKSLVEQQDPTHDLIEANHDTILQMHEEAVRRLREILDPVLVGAESQVRQAIAVLDALNQFHPMHGESWCGWPAEEK